jgi:hypothetical protein
MNYIKKIAFLCLAIPFMSCALQNEAKPKINQGIYGNVRWLAGNQMPSPDEPRNSGAIVQRKISIYEITSFKQTVGMAPLFTEIKTKLVKTIISNKKGYYEASLAPGFYSIFTQEPEGGYFANTFNGEGQIAVVEIKKGEVFRFDININYKAIY